ncbi:MAG: GNAT family N-acetyltransferase [Pseudomonadota bacterium]
MMEQLEIHLEESDTKGRYYSDTKDGAFAEMTFTKAGEGLMIIDHTEVPKSLSGLGLGVRLVECGVAYARETGRKIVPLCPYAAHQFRKHSEWHDVLNK